jgi:serine protease Do
MRRVLLLLIVMASVLPPARLAAADIQDLYARAHRSIVLLKVYDRFGTEDGQGTGFVVPGGYVVTNHHVVADAAHVQAFAAPGEGFQLIGLLADDERQDLAVLKPAPHALEALLLAARQPRIGEHVVVLGNPLGLASTLSEGIVSAYREAGLKDDPDGWHKDTPLLQISAPISHGSSGSPVLDSEGKVLGVAVGAYFEGQNLNFAIPATTLETLLRTVNPDRMIKEYKRSASPLLRNLTISGCIFAVLFLGIWRLGRK